MKDADCVSFLQWALPQIGLRWQGLRRVHRQVCKRLKRRLGALHLEDLADYRVLLERSSEEWKQLDALCRISISRFYRDRGVFERLEGELLPRLQDQARARGDSRLRIWSAGCASGEEPYTLALMWAFNAALSSCGAEIVATDSDPGLLARARRACYRSSSLRELPAAWRAAFEPRGDDWCLKAEHQAAVSFLEQDIREQTAEGPFDLVLCRNLVFTYFEQPVQFTIARRMAQALVPGGLLVLGAHESLPGDVSGFEAESPWLYRRRSS
ncbi:MAG: CheR family methyltransferase [Pseudomonadota bacterium]